MCFSQTLCRSSVAVQFRGDGGRGIGERGDETRDIESIHVHDDADRGDTLAVAQDGHRDRPASSRHLFTRDRVTALAHVAQFGAQGIRLGNRLGHRLAQGCGDVLFDGGRRLVGQQHLADPRGVQGQVATRTTDRRDAALTDQAIDVERLTAIEHSKRDVFARLFVESSKRRQRALAQSVAQRCVLRNRPEFRADAVFAIGASSDERAGLERGDDSMARRQWQARLLGDFRERESALRGIEAAKDLHRSLEQGGGCAGIDSCGAHRGTFRIPFRNVSRMASMPWKSDLENEYPTDVNWITHF